MTINTPAGEKFLDDNAVPSQEDRTEIISSQVDNAISQASVSLPAAGAAPSDLAQKRGQAFAALCEAAVNFSHQSNAAFAAACEGWLIEHLAPTPQRRRGRGR